MLRKLELLILLLMLAGFVALNSNIQKMVISEQVEVKKSIVLDAGHGGKDPGKIGVNGELEKEINLQIAEKVKKLLEEKGIDVIMTREDDVNHGNKREDMNKRVEMINRSEAVFAVSIHQNSFQDPDISGAQVFYYSGSEEGKHYAEIMQNELLKIDDNNKRQAKSNDNYYLLTKTEIPTIIVECGFLSNGEEARKLAGEEYQDVVSNAIVKGIESCFMN